MINIPYSGMKGHVPDYTLYLCSSTEPSHKLNLYRSYCLTAQNDNNLVFHDLKTNLCMRSARRREDVCFGRVLSSKIKRKLQNNQLLQGKRYLVAVLDGRYHNKLSGFIIQTPSIVFSVDNAATCGARQCFNNKLYVCLYIQQYRALSPESHGKTMRSSLVSDPYSFPFIKHVQDKDHRLHLALTVR